MRSLVIVAQSLTYTFMANPSWGTFHFCSCHGKIGTEIVDKGNGKKDSIIHFLILHNYPGYCDQWKINVFILRIHINQMFFQHYNHTILFKDKHTTLLSIGQLVWRMFIFGPFHCLKAVPFITDHRHMRHTSPWATCS